METIKRQKRKLLVLPKLSSIYSLDKLPKHQNQKQKHESRQMKSVNDTLETYNSSASSSSIFNNINQIYFLTTLTKANEIKNWAIEDKTMGLKVATNHQFSSVSTTNSVFINRNRDTFLTITPTGHLGECIDKKSPKSEKTKKVRPFRQNYFSDSKISTILKDSEFIEKKLRFNPGWRSKVYNKKLKIVNNTHSESVVTTKIKDFKETYHEQSSANFNNKYNFGLFSKCPQVRIKVKKISKWLRSGKMPGDIKDFGIEEAGEAEEQVFIRKRMMRVKRKWISENASLDKNE